MAYEFWYEGTPYSLEPSYGELFIGYRMPAVELALTTDARTANQLKETSDKINPGGTAIEISAISPEVFEAVPEQHLKEIDRLTKLTGVQTSVHGPLVEPSGITKQGWSEESRESAERQLQMAVERSHKISPDGNIPVTLHSAAALPGPTPAIIEEEGKKKEIEQQIPVINQETKQITAIGKEKRIYPEEIAGKPAEEIKPEIRTPREEIDIVNKSDWHSNLTQVIFYKNRGDEIIETYYPTVKNIWKDLIPKLEKGKITPEKFESIIKELPGSQRAALDKVRLAREYIENSQLVLRSLFNRAYKYGTEEEKKFLKKAADKYGEKIKIQDPAIQSEAVQDLAIQMERVSPKLYVPIEDFAVEHSAKTFGNVAFNAYKKFGDKAPIINIENPPAGMGFSRAEDIKKMVEKSREEFIKKAVEKGYSKGQAKAAAEKLIGATWDVGHINMLRRYGFGKEELLKETEKIAPFVKHVHLSDNFGFEHTELPMGMGTVPTKEMLEKLEKAGFKGKKVIEALSWWQHFKTPPLVPTLEAFGSPLYPMYAQPTWNQIAYTFGGYFSGYGPILPEQHFSMYGAGFSGMPAELGGQMPGREKGRLAEAA